MSKKDELFKCFAAAGLVFAVISAFRGSDVAAGTNPVRILSKQCVLPFLQSVFSPRTSSHGDLEETLFLGEVESARRLSGNNLNEVWSVTLRNSRNEKRVVAIVKPRKFGDGEGWNDVSKEYVAYYENQKLLGMDYIPPIAYRYRFELRDSMTGVKTFVHEGSVSYFVPQAKKLVDVPEAEWGVSKRALLSDHRILRVLLGDPDGHEAQVLFGQDWASAGETVKNKPFFIDFAASGISFSKVQSSGLAEENLSMIHYPKHTGVFGGPITVIRRSTYQRLRNLQVLNQQGKGAELFKDIEAFVDEEFRRKFFRQVDEILSYFDQLESTHPGQTIINE